MTSDEFINRCKQEVKNYYKTEVIPFDDNNNFLFNIEEFIDNLDVFAVWYCKTLQNHKAILSTHYSDQRLFEFTYNGDKDEIYLDCYDKECNRKVEL